MSGYGRKYCDERDIQKIKDLLIGRRVVSVGVETMTLDNGTRVIIMPNEGCGGCNSGNYWVEHLERVNNAITDVEVDCDYVDKEEYDTVYRIYVYANGMQHELLRVVGTDGSGYYGTGYELRVQIEE